MVDFANKNTNYFDILWDFQCTLEELRALEELQDEERSNCIKQLGANEANIRKYLTAAPSAKRSMILQNIPRP
jgi:hypothetical protein